MVLTGEKENDRIERRVIAEGSRAADEGAAVGSQGSQVVRWVGLLGSLPVLESPGTASRAY